jgi:hypothetical protein
MRFLLCEPAAYRGGFLCLLTQVARVVVVAIAFANAALPAKADVATEWPTELQVTFEEAWEAFYDGRYDDAVRLADQCQAWSNSESNKKLLSSLRLDWFVIESQVMILQAEALAKKDQKSLARSKMKLAQSRLQSRRASAMRRGLNSAAFTLAEAHLCFAEGDLDRPLPDFAMAERIVGIVHDTAMRRGNPARAERYYRKGTDILERSLGVTVNAIPEAEIAVGPLFRANQLMVRLLVSSALSKMLKSGIPTAAEIDDATSYLVRAEEVHANNYWWKTYFCQSAPKPISYYEIQEAADSKLKAVGVQQKDKLPSERNIVLIKMLAWESIWDWYRILCARAEAEAYREMLEMGVSGSSDYAVPNAELAYKRACNVLRYQFRHDHPVLADVEISNARWFSIRSRPSRVRGGKISRAECTFLVSLCRDCIYYIGRRRLVGLQVDRQWELNFLELRAIDNLVEIDSLAEVPFLTPQQKKEIEGRRLDLQRNQGDLVPRL